MIPRNLPDACQSRRGVLLLDDEPVVLNVLTSALTTAGFEVFQARTAEQARSLFDTHAAELCLAIIDIRLAGPSGVDFVRSLPTLEPRIPMLFITGLGDREVENLAPEGPVLYKPFTVNALLDAVQNAVSPEQSKALG